MVTWVLAGTVSSAVAWSLNEESGVAAAESLPDGFYPALVGGVGVASGAIEPPGPKYNTLTGAPYTAPASAFEYWESKQADQQPVSDFIATANWGDGTITGATVRGGGGGRYEVSASSHAYANPGTYAFSYTVRNVNSGLSTTLGGEKFYVWSVPQPIAGSSPRTIHATVGASWSGVVAEFAYESAQVSTSTYFVEIVWGDRSLSPGTITAQGNGTFAVTGSHTYTQPGTVAIEVRVYGAPGPELGNWTTATAVADDLVASPAATTTPKAARECVVPSLVGDSLPKARRALREAHCRLGKISRPRRHEHVLLVVTRQSMRRGRRLEAGADVALTIGPTLAHPRR